MSRFISILCVVAISISFAPIITLAVFESSEISETEKNNRITQLAQDRIESISETDNINLATEKKLLDFDGNEYCLFEYSPTGYAIFDENSGIFLETTSSSLSPYLGYDDNIFYGGPTQYYYLSEDGYINLFTDAILGNDDVAYFEAYSKALVNELNNNKNDDVVNYLTNKFASTEAITAATVTTYYVSSYNRLKNLEYCGYTTALNGEGICGYIAAAMLLYYFDSSGRRDVIPNNYYKTEGSYYVLDSNLSGYLYNTGVYLGHGSGTTSGAIQDTVKEYLRLKSITTNVSHTSLYLPTQYTIFSKIANSNLPVIIFGALYSPAHNAIKTHAVLAYGCRYTLGSSVTYEFITHFGYDTYTHIYLTGIFSSMYALSC